MKLHIAVMLTLLLGAGCKRKNESTPDAGPQTTGSAVVAPDASPDAKPYFYTAHLDDVGQPKFSNEATANPSRWVARHGHQPTKWLLWTSRPLTVAKSQAKPVLLFVGEIGCSSCVAPSVRFDDEALAKVVNEGYVSVVVDERDRPDIAQFVRESAAVMTGKAPRSLLVALTWEGHVARDFSAAANLEALSSELTAFAEEHKTKRAAVEEAAKETTAKVRKRQLDLSGKAPKGRPQLDRGLESLQASFDGEHAGWPRGGAKSPSPQLVRFALRAARWSEDKDAAVAMATQTLDKMAEALADGGGFVTSAADPGWKLEYKVKSLDDNAMLLMAYTEAWQLTQSERFEKAARDIATFILSDLKAPEGGFYAHAIERPDGETVLDRRVLAEANGVAMSALARAGWVFDELEWVAAAGVAAKQLPVLEGKIVHSKGSKVGYSADFAAVVDGLLSLFEATADSSYLRRAVLVQNQLDVMYWDNEQGGYFHVPVSLADDLPVRMKLHREHGGVPSANSLAMLNATRLAAFRDDPAMTKRRDELLNAVGGVIAAEPLSSPTALVVLDWLAGDSKRVAVVGDERKAMLEVLRTNFFPHMVYATVAKNSAVPWLAGKEPRAEKATAFVCRASCGEPITEPSEFKKALLTP